MAEDSEPCLPRRKRGELRSKLGKVIAVDIAEAVHELHALDTIRTFETAIPALAPKSNLPEQAAKLECSSPKRGLLLSTIVEVPEAPWDDTTLPTFQLPVTVRGSEEEGQGGSSGDLSLSAAAELSPMLSRATSTELSPLLGRSARNRKLGRCLLVLVLILYLIGLGALSRTCCWLFAVGFITINAMAVILPIVIVLFFF